MRPVLRSAMPALPAKPDLLDCTDMIVAAAGGERDIPADSAILTGHAQSHRARTHFSTNG